MQKPLRIALFMLLLLCLSVGLLFAPTDNTTLAQNFGDGWTGQYYNNESFDSNPVFTRVDAQINFNFGSGSPADNINSDYFSIRWNSLENFENGTYRFFAGAQDGIKVTIDGNTIIDSLTNTGAFQLRTADVEVAGGTRDITVEYVAYEGNAAVQFYWEPINILPTATAGPSPTPTATGLPPIPAGAVSATVIRAAVLNVRQAPSLGGNILGRIRRGQTYQVVGRNVDASWFLLRLADRDAWAYGYYLFIDGNEFNPPVVSGASAFNFPAGVQDTGVLVQSQAGMKLRAAPNVLSNQIGRITWGAFLPVIGRTAANDWYQVVWKGTVGWVYTGYLKPVQGDATTVAVTG